MVLINQEIPNFILKAFYNEKLTQIKLSDYKGQWLILFFYPGDFTFICPTELAELADHYEQFKKLGAEILSVSTDSVYVHKAWHDTSKIVKDIKFPMLADPTGALCKAFGTYIETEGKTLRGTFLIDPDQKLMTMEIHHNDIGRSASELLRKLEAAKFVRENNGEVCPASWKPGKKTLKPGLNLVGKL